MRVVRPTDPAQQRALDALAKLENAGCELVVATQNLIEFWAAATRPDGDKGLGYTPADAAYQVDRFARDFMVLPEPAAAYVRWHELVERYGVKGKPTHDAHLVGTMLANGVTRALTFNGPHFARFVEIAVEAP